MSTQQGYFLIADITGYTNYLSKSELEHAQQTLTALLNLLIKHTRPPLIISRLAGDAVISYGLRDNFFQGQTFVEMIEDTYVAFRRTIDLMVMNTTCPCNACRNINTLDLKFFVHYGAFGIQKLDGHDEMVGADVIVIHRLLKNTVTKKTSLWAYALYTDAAIQQLGLEDICSVMIPHEEVHEHLGAVKTWIQDLRPIWENKKTLSHIPFPPMDIIVQVATDITLPPEKVWDYLIQPEYFNVLAGGTHTVLANRRVGRVTEGSVYQCFHGDMVFPQTILEWRPFERILVQIEAPIRITNTFVLVEYRLETNVSGIRLIQSFSKASGSFFGRIMANQLFKSMADVAQHDLDNFKNHIKADFATRIFTPERVFPSSETVSAAASDRLSASVENKN